MEKVVFAKSHSDVMKGISDETLAKKKETWKVIISDDEEQVHEITKLALSHFSFADQELQFISAFTGRDTIEAIKDHPDTAIILQDVVMETDNAGLEVVKYVREVLNNEFVRIILRTGQPGQAPERKVIVDYDINDYKEKTELTSQKLFTLMYASLRSYRNILTIERSKAGLQKILNTTAEIFSRQSLDKFMSATLMQLTSLLHNNDDALMCNVSRFKSGEQANKLEITSAIGEYTDLIGQNVNNVLNVRIVNLLNQSLANKKNIYQSGCCVAYFSSRAGDEQLLYFKGSFNLSEVDKHLVDLFIKQVSISYDNLTLYEKVEQGQQEIVNLLGTSIETRSKETGNHIKRVAEFSYILAKKWGLNNEECEVLKLASPLHDLGKIGIPDAILNKPGKLDADEWEIMMTHTELGYDMLIESDCEILQAGAFISHEHHEKWDGSGYPKGKKGEDIHIYGRITAVADVFDALASERCYKKSWPMEDILMYFKEQRGLHFDPLLTDILLENVEQFTNVLERYKD